MAKKKEPKLLTDAPQIDENSLFLNVSYIIEQRRSLAYSYANLEIVQMYWEIGRFINTSILENRRAAYGKQIFSTLSRKLAEKYGKSFERENLYRMTQFAELFPEIKIVSSLAGKLSWSHFCELIRLESEEARLYYATDAASRHLGIRDLRKQISRKAYERQEIANSQLSEESTVPFNMFKDPYLLDTLGLKENFLEADLEKAILTELESFILEFGHGFTFVERQKRMTMDGDDFRLDLLFYHRVLKRLVAIELKLEKFRPEFKGQMEFYLKWLNRYERQADEKEPIGLILCPHANRGQLELLEMDKSGIAVAEFWTVMPPKREFERKINEIMQEAKERLERRKTFTVGEIRKQIEYFYESKDAEEDE